MSVNFWLQALVRFVAGMSTLEEMAARAQKRSASMQMAFEGAEAEVFNIPFGGSSRDVRPRTTVMDEEEIHRRLMGEQPQVDTSQAENSSSGPSVAPRIPVQRSWPTDPKGSGVPSGCGKSQESKFGGLRHTEHWRNPNGKSECRVVGYPKQSAAKRSRSIG